MAAKKANRGSENSHVEVVQFILLVASAAVLLGIYVYVPFESAVPVPDYTKGNILDHHPEMKHLTSLKLDHTDGVQVFDECARKSHCFTLQRAFGILDKDLSREVRQSQLDCCMAVVQHWYTHGSHPPELYPITWGGMVKVWTDIGEEDFAGRMKNSLQKLVEKAQLKKL